MAIDLSHSIESIEIDNRIAGVVSGELTLKGSSHPTKLVLEGDCWRDLAGAKFTARNRLLVMDWLGDALPEEIHGQVGDCTASRKEVQVSTGEGDQEAGIESWHPSLTLEWFSESRQRYLVHGTHFQLEIEESEWQMSREEESAQQMANQQAMRDYVCQVVQPPGAAEEPDPDDNDEFAWELRLQHSDRLNDAYGEVMAKYADDSDSETKEAFVMGWDHLLGSLADESERSPGQVSGDDQFDPSDWFDFDLGATDEDSYEDEVEIVQHPLQRRAMDLVVDHSPAINQLHGKVPAEDIEAFYIPFLKISGKLAAALNGDTMEQEPGYSLAVLKRCINWLQQALSALPTLAPALGQRQAKDIKDSLFQLREGIIEIRNQLKNGDNL